MPFSLGITVSVAPPEAKAMTGRPAAMDSIGVSPRSSICGRINHFAVSAVIFVDSSLHGFGIGDKMVHSVRAHSVPKTEFMYDAGQSHLDDTAVFELGYIFMRVGPEIAGRGVAVGDMQSVRFDDQSLGE